MLSAQNKADMVFVRHAESLFNSETLEYVARKQIEYDWAHLSQDHEYLAAHKYSQHLLDATITPKGYQECAAAREQLRDFNPDLILVSPLNRTLLTCSLVFPNPKCPVIVEPVLSEAVRSACDLSSEIPSKKQLYPSYNFENVEKEGAFWFLKNESEVNQAAYAKILSQNQDKPYEEILKAIFAMMLETWIYETATNLRHRTDRVKALLREYRKSYTRIAVVSHYNIIRFSLAKEFNEVDEPFHSHIANCEVLPAEIAQL